MALELYGHPFSSYCWKALIALYEKGLDFDFRVVGPDQPANAARFAELAPLGKFPLLVDGAHVVPEATIIIEYLDRLGGPPMIPADPDAAMSARMFDRIYDNYVMTPMSRTVADFLRPEGERNPADIRDAKAMLDKSYAWLDRHMAGREWAATDAFTLAECAAAPSLFYADWVHPIPDAMTDLKAYRTRLLARPSVSRAVDEARPYRSYFPPGAPDRD